MRRRHRTDNELRTTYRVRGADDVDEFRALCALLGRRPHQLVAELVNAQLTQMFANDPSLAGDVSQLVAAARHHQRDHEIRDLNAKWEASRS